MKRTRRKSGKDALELIEEAVHQLRAAPAATLAVYFLGTIPFVLGTLFFFADMSRDPFADQHLAELSLGVAILFLWMKFFQALFTRRIRAQIGADSVQGWTPRQCWKVFLLQAIVQPAGLFVIPLALIPALPFAWVYAFYQNVTVLADDATRDKPGLLKKAWKQASLWPRQNHLVLTILSFFGLYVFLNLAVACFSIPGLIKMLFGVESLFTKSPLAVLNTTFFSAMFGLTYLCVDPILKVLYTLRCFYGESLQSGEDLKAELKQFANPVQPVLALILCIAALASATAANGADENSTPASPAGPQVSQPGVPPPELDRAINRVIHERKYTWRMPREKTVSDDAQEGVLTRFMDKAGKLLRKWAVATLDWLRDVLRKMFGRRSTASSGGGSGYGWIMSLQILLYVLVAVVVCALILLLIRVWRRRGPASPAIAGEAIQPAPDIRDENLVADQLPEDGWTKLARDLLERGEFRLALRAFYLASLANLAQRNLIRIARFKSNHEYESELRRRGHAIQSLLPVFGENLSILERIWYGMHEVNRDIVLQFAANVERIKTGA